MSEEMITEERVKEIVQQYLSARMEDVDEIRKSPAGRVLIIETEVKNLNEKIDRLDEKVDRLDAKVESVKIELKKEIDCLDAKVESVKIELKKEIDRLDAKVESVRSELKKEILSSKNLSLALFLAVLGLIGSIFVKVFFFM